MIRAVLVFVCCILIAACGGSDSKSPSDKHDADNVKNDIDSALPDVDDSSDIPDSVMTILICGLCRRHRKTAQQQSNTAYSHLISLVPASICSNDALLIQIEA